MFIQCKQLVICLFAYKPVAKIAHLNYTTIRFRRCSISLLMVMKAAVMWSRSTNQCSWQWKHVNSVFEKKNLPIIIIYFSLATGEVEHSGACLPYDRKSPVSIPSAGHRVLPRSQQIHAKMIP